jgi:CBS domain-containing protein
MTERNFHTIPVVDGGRLVGIIGMRDILRAIVT